MKIKSDFSKILEGAERFQEKGIKFRLADKKDEDKVWNFLLEEFLPDEPVIR